MVKKRKKQNGFLRNTKKTLEVGAISVLAGLFVYGMNRRDGENYTREIGEVIPENPVSDDVSENQERNYRKVDFKFPEELDEIEFHARRIGVEPEILMAIRMAEQGGEGLEYGIMPLGAAKERYDNDPGYFVDENLIEYSGDDSKQLSWAAWTVKKNMERFETDREGYLDFIDFLGDRYAPVGSANDPTGLNENWEKNVRYFYDAFKRQR